MQVTLKKIRHAVVQNPFAVGIFVNCISTGVLGVCGLAINFLIAHFYSTAGLGLFNLIVALQIGLSQFSTFGLHYSVLKYTAENSKKKEALKEILATSIALVLFTSLIVLFFCLIVWTFIGKVFKFQNLSEAWLIAIPGIVLFSINKVFFAFLNGQNRMLIFSFLTSLRYLSFLIVLIFLICTRAPSYILSSMISIAELIVFFSCLWLLKGEILCLPKRSEWYKRHMLFGQKSFFAGAAIELNSRVDVIILSYFTNECFVGIYSLALFMIEGLLQFIVVIRNSLNPLITQYVCSRSFGQLEKKIKKVCLFSLFSMLILLCGAAFFYKIYIGFFPEDNIYDSVNIFYILMAGLIFSVYYLPLQFFPNQVGYPVHQSYLNSAILFSNILLNIAFCYTYGFYGAAIATALSFILSAFMIREYVDKFLKKLRSEGEYPLMLSHIH